MKSLVTGLLLVLSLVVSPTSVAQRLTNCASSISDSDGDGFGWENNASCIVVTGAAPESGGQCEDRGGFPWGWNPITLISCRLDEQPQQQSFDSIINTLINQRNNYWRCRTNPLEDSRSNVLDVVFQEDGVASVIFAGIDNQGSPLPGEFGFAVDSHPGSWSRGYPIVDRELHINGTFTISTRFGNSGFADHIGDVSIDEQYFNRWQIILQDINLLDEPVNYRIFFTDTSVELESFEATMNYKDSITDLSFPVTCTTAFPQLFDYIPYER